MAASTGPPSPSPPSPPPPTALTPGPLATRLTTLYHTALTHTLRACSYENFAACFPTPAAQRPAVLRGLWAQVVGKIEEKGRAEFEGILGERGVVGSLNALEGAVEGGRGRRAVGRERGEGAIAAHLLPPVDLYNAHLAPRLGPVQAELEERLRGTRARNEELAAMIRKQREEVEGLIGGLEAVVRDLEGANEVLGGVVGGVRGELVEMGSTGGKGAREARL